VTIGVISDTHGLLRPQAVQALQGSDLIIHAGDVGKPEILEELRRIAPTFAVRGNVDTAAWAAKLPLTEVVDVGVGSDFSRTIRDRIVHPLYVLHDLATLDLDPKAAGFAVVISGHTHKPLAETRNGVLYLNPGSAGPKRFSLPICLARLHVSNSGLRHEFIELLI
jgi:putative phosphoesterase